MRRSRRAARARWVVPGNRQHRRSKWVRNERGEWVRSADTNDLAITDTGERCWQRVRGQFAKWAAATGGCFLLNLATGITDGPWFLFVAAGFGFPLLKSYSQLWQAGYSWRDVLNPPPAADAIKIPGAKGRRMISPPKASDFGLYFDRMNHVHDDRKNILRMMQQLPDADRKQLPEVVETAEALYERAADLARTLHEMDQSFGAGSGERIRAQLDMLVLRAEGDERNRQIGILERQLKTPPTCPCAGGLHPAIRVERAGDAKSPARSDQAPHRGHRCALRRHQCHAAGSRDLARRRKPHRRRGRDPRGAGVTSPGGPFDNREYWESRLRQQYSLAGVGYLRLGRRFNEWMYRVRGEVFDRVGAGLRPVSGERLA